MNKARNACTEMVVKCDTLYQIQLMKFGEERKAGRFSSIPPKPVVEYLIPCLQQEKDHINAKYSIKCSFSLIYITIYTNCIITYLLHHQTRVEI